jgi:ApaG protein
MYSATTKEITVTVRPVWLEEQSDPAAGRFVWAYHVRIENNSAGQVQLLSRYWHITDGMGRVQEVRGPGVVGEQPVLQPGESFEYASGTPLATPSGIMVGHYVMSDARGNRFEVAVPAFSLDSPQARRVMN